MSEVRIPKAGMISQKAHFCELCDLDLGDILHLTEHQRQKLYDIGAWEKHLYLSVKHQHRKQHIGDMPQKQDGQSLIYEQLQIFCVGEVTFLWGIHTDQG